MTDVRGFGISFTDVTLRMRVVAGLSGDHVRLELSNRFGDLPLVVGRAEIAVGDTAVLASFEGRGTATIPAGQARWTDPVALTVRRGDKVRIDLYLPGPTPHSTANFTRAHLQVSIPGDHVGTLDFPAITAPTVPAPDGSVIPMPLPILRGIEVSGRTAEAVVVCLGDSITAGGWPAIAAAMFPVGAEVAMLDRGIAGNRLRTDPAPSIASFGRSGLSRFDEDGVATAGATDVVIALGTNDLGLPGAVAPLDELPTASEMIDAYRQLTERAAAAGLRVIIATITPFLPAEGYDSGREQIREAVNAWIRTCAPEMVDFDAAIRSGSSPSQLAGEYDSGDHLHPNEAGEAQLAQAMVRLVRRR
jgi:lysophospholipase L1-like esterase